MNKTCQGGFFSFGRSVLNAFLNPYANGKVYCITPDILNSGALFLSLDKDKKVIKISANE